MDSRDESARIASLLSGTVAGTSRVLLGHPIDTLKVLQQTRHLRDKKSNLITNNLKYSSSVGSRLRSQVKLAYRGILPPLISTSLLTSANFFLYENARLSILNAFDPRSEAGNLLVVFISGTIAGSTLCFVTSPLENIKVIQQVSQSNKNIFYWIRTLATGYHGASPYRALVPNLVQGGIGRGFYLGAYAWVKSLGNHYNPGFSDTLGGKLVAASGAGISGWLFTFPFDVIRNNMMADWEKKKFKTTLQCARSLYSNGGLSAMYSGLGFTLIRAVPVSCVALTSYDFTQTYLLSKLTES